MMLTQHRGYRTRNEGLQGNPELDVMEAGGGAPGARDAKAGRKERAVGSEEGWGG